MEGLWSRIMKGHVILLEMSLRRTYVGMYSMIFCCRNQDMSSFWQITYQAQLSQPSFPIASNHLHSFPSRQPKLCPSNMCDNLLSSNCCIVSGEQDSSWLHKKVNPHRRRVYYKLNNKTMSVQFPRSTSFAERHTVAGNIGAWVAAVGWTLTLTR